MILMSKYKGQHGGKKGQKIRARPSPNPFSGNARKKSIFLMGGLPLVWHAWHTWSCLGIRRGTYLFAHLVWSRNHLAPVSLFLRYGRPVSLAPNFRTIHYNVSEDCLYSTMPVLPAPYINPIHRPKLAASGRCGLLKIWSRRCCFHKTITSHHVSLLLRYCLACH